MVSDAADLPTGEVSDDEVIAFAQDLLDAARRGEARRLATVIDAGVPVDLTAASGDTLLMLAAYHGHTEVVAALLERGADPDRANDRGQTPLAGAIFKKEPEVARLLLAAGADADLGSPSARETARMFGQQALLEEPSGHGSGRAGG